MDRQGGVVRLNDSVGDLGRRDDGEGSHHAVGEFLADLGDEQSAHAGSGSSSERVGELELLIARGSASRRVEFTRSKQTYTLKAVGSLSLLANDIEDSIDEFGSLGVVLQGRERISTSHVTSFHTTHTLGPVVSSSRLAKDEIVGACEGDEGDQFGAA